MKVQDELARIRKLMRDLEREWLNRAVFADVQIRRARRLLARAERDLVVFFYAGSLTIAERERIERVLRAVSDARRALPGGGR